MTDVVISVPRRVEFADTDASGRIHSTAAMRWAEEAEHEWLRACGIADVRTFPRATVQVTFHAPLGFATAFELELHLIRIGRRSIEFGWRGVDANLTYFDGRHVIVHVDANGRSCDLPRVLANALAPVASASEERNS